MQTRKTNDRETGFEADPHTVRILFCTDTYPPQVNGVSVVTARSVQGLTERGWDCAVVAPRYPRVLRDPFTDDALANAPRSVYRVASTTLPLYPEARLCAPDYGTVASAVRSFGPDIVHSATEFIVGRLGQIAAPRSGIPITSSYHTDFAKYAAEYGFAALGGPVSRYLARFHRRSRRVYTPSGPARDYLLRIGVPNVEVWGRGVDVDTFRPERRSTALRLALGLDGRFTFLYAGRLAAEKNVRCLLDAYRIARGMLDGDRLRLVIAGAGPEERAIRAAAPEGVRFLGYLERTTALPELYASCDAFVFASLTETLGLVVLEAMASGLPVIAAPAGGVGDHLRHRGNGLAYPPGDAQAMAEAMIRLACDGSLARHLSANARATAEELDWCRELDRLDHSYREVIERGVRHAAPDGAASVAPATPPS